MNQPTEAFLIQLRDLYRAHGVDFAADLNGVPFTSTMAWEDLPDESLILAAAGAMDDELNALAEQTLANAIREATPSASDAAIARFVAHYGSAWTVKPGYGPYDGCGDGALDRLAGLIASCEGENRDD